MITVTLVFKYYFHLYLMKGCINLHGNKNHPTRTFSLPAHPQKLAYEMYAGASRANFPPSAMYHQRCATHTAADRSGSLFPSEFFKWHTLSFYKENWWTPVNFIKVPGQWSHDHLSDSFDVNESRCLIGVSIDSKQDTKLRYLLMKWSFSDEPSESHTIKVEMERWTHRVQNE